MFLCLCQSSGEDILASLRELEDALNEAGPVDRPEGQTPNSSFHQECLYYLNTYGTHLALISFYMRRDCMTEALTYLLNKVFFFRIKIKTFSFRHVWKHYFSFPVCFNHLVSFNWTSTGIGCLSENRNFKLLLWFSLSGVRGSSDPTMWFITPLLPRSFMLQNAIQYTKSVWLWFRLGPLFNVTTKHTKDLALPAVAWSVP